MPIYIRELIQAQPIVAGLLGGVIAFGNRERIRTVFGDKIQGNIEVTDVRARDLVHEYTVTKGLYYELIEKALINDYALVKVGRRTFYFPMFGNSLPEPFQFEHQGERYVVEKVTRIDAVIVNEAFTYQLDFHEGTLWFVLEPKVVVTSDGRNLAAEELRQTITNRILSRRYNAEAHKLLLFWLYYFSSIDDPISFSFPSRKRLEFRMLLDTHYSFSYRQGYQGRPTHANTGTLLY